DAVDRLGEDARVQRRGVVEQDAGAGGDLGTGRQAVLGDGRVGHQAPAGPLGVVRRQDALGRVGRDLARVWVDGLEQPGGGVGEDVDAGADAQDEPLGPDEVEIPLERTEAGRDVYL